MIRCQREVWHNLNGHPVCTLLKVAQIWSFVLWSCRKWNKNVKPWGKIWFGRLSKFSHKPRRRKNTSSKNQRPEGKEIEQENYDRLKRLPLMVDVEVAVSGEWMMLTRFLAAFYTLFSIFCIESLIRLSIFATALAWGWDILYIPSVFGLFNVITVHLCMSLGNFGICGSRAPQAFHLCIMP